MEHALLIMATVAYARVVLYMPTKVKSNLSSIKPDGGPSSKSRAVFDLDQERPYPTRKPNHSRIPLTGLLLVHKVHPRPA